MTATTATDRTTGKFANTLKANDVVVIRPANGGIRLRRVAGTSRAAASSDSRICVFLADVDGSRIPGLRNFYDVDERVEVLFDALPALKRQSCRGCLETGISTTVGTLPTGEVRPYETEIVDGGRFHYCAACAEKPEIRARLSASEIRRIRADRDALAGLADRCLGLVVPGATDCGGHAR